MSVRKKGDVFNCEDCSVQVTVKNNKARKYPDKCRSCSGKVNASLKKHGFRSTGPKTKLYASWVSMRDRVNNPKNKDYVEGVKLHNAWIESFPNLKEWAESNGYIEGKSSIRRKDTKGDYTPENCKVVNRYTKKYMYGNRLLTAGQIYDLLPSCAVDKEIFRRRLRRGTPLNRALMEPAKINAKLYRSKKWLNQEED